MSTLIYIDCALSSVQQFAFNSHCRSVSFLLPISISSVFSFTIYLSFTSRFFFICLPKRKCTKLGFVSVLRTRWSPNKKALFLFWMRNSWKRSISFLKNKWISSNTLRLCCTSANTSKSGTMIPTNYPNFGLVGVTSCENICRKWSNRIEKTNWQSNKKVIQLEHDRSGRLMPLRVMTSYGNAIIWNYSLNWFYIGWTMQFGCVDMRN